MNKTEREARNLARLKQTDDGFTLQLFGVVGDWFDGFTDEDLAELTSDLTGPGLIRLNSPGGYVFQGINIYAAIASIPGGDVTIRVEGLAASAASIIAMAGNRLEMSPGSMLMIHNPWNEIAGDAAEFRKSADVLDKMRDSLVEIYRAKTGIETEALLDMMNAETWFTAEEAVAAGFADAVVDFTDAAGDAEDRIRSLDLSPILNAKHAPAGIRAMARAQSRKQKTGNQPNEAKTMKKCGIKGGATLGALLEDQIQILITDDVSRADVITQLAEAAEIDEAAVNSIVNGETNCPPLVRLEGFANVLEASVEQLRTAAEADGCDYSEGGDASDSTQTGVQSMNEKDRAQAAARREREEGAKAERKRSKDIRAAVAAASMPGELAEEMIDDGLTVDEAQANIKRLQRYMNAGNSGGDSAESVSNRQRIEITREERDTKRGGMILALMNRQNPAKHKISGDSPARQFAHLSLREIAREAAEARGVRTRGMTPHEIARAALHTTSDFPEVLANVMNKTLRDAYELAPRVFLELGRRATAPDFREISRTQLGEAPQLHKVLEGGEYEYGTVGDAAEKYRLFKYGRIVAVSSEAIINDDLDAFTRLPTQMGGAAAQLESQLFFAQVTGNPTMHDGTALFAAGHGNLAASGSAISVDSIGAARAAMRQQKGLDGKHFLNVQPRTLVVPTALETKAEQFISVNLQADSAGSVNPFAGRLQAVAEPRLDVDSATAWYLFGDPNQVDTIEYAYLQGEEGPVIERQEGFDTDGIRTKVRHNFAARAIDWRGMYKNPGA